MGFLLVSRLTFWHFANAIDFRGTTMKAMILGMLFALTTTSVMAKSFIGLGLFQSEFLGSEYDRSYKSNVNNIRQVNFGYNDKDLLEIFGGVNIDDDNEVVDFALGFALKDKIIRLERGKISGTIIDEDGPVLGTFDNEYQRIDVLETSINYEGFQWGLGVQRYATPHLFKFNDGSIGGANLQDDALSYNFVGLGLFYDPIYQYLMSDQIGFKSDWYFATSGLAVSVAYAKSSDAPALMARGMNGKSWLLWGSSNTYELGWLWGYQTPLVSVVANVGYHLRANTLFNLNPLELFAYEADEGDISLSSSQSFLHGVTAAVSVSF